MISERMKLLMIEVQSTAIDLGELQEDDPTYFRYMREMDEAYNALRDAIAELEELVENSYDQRNDE
jgi:predicted proteasome-type protease